MRKDYRYCSFVFILLCVSYLASAQEGHFIPDTNLRRVVGEKLGKQQFTEADMLVLFDIVSLNDNISNLKGLEHAINIGFLHIGYSQVFDLKPLANLTKLHTLKLHDNRISDIRALSGLVNLQHLELQVNLIEDFSPLLQLTGLQNLHLSQNPGDVKALSIGLNPIDFAICRIEKPAVSPRVSDRNYPSTFAAWHNIINKPLLTWEERIAFHDLYFCCLHFGMRYIQINNQTKVLGWVERAQQIRETFPKLYLASVGHYAAPKNQYPEDWEYWLRDNEGNLVQDAGWDQYLIDYTQKGAQDHFVNRIIAIAQCGLYDGILLDWWSEEWNTLYNRNTGEIYRPLEAEVDAKVSILRRVREEVGDDFLILVNTNRTKIPRSGPYVNGTFMETLRDNDQGYTYEGLKQIESTLLWAERNLKSPQINCLEGWGLETEPLDSPSNKKWMRVFTTISLTHSDGYVNFVTGITGGIDHTHAYSIWDGHNTQHHQGIIHDHQHEHYWYEFWNANLGQPTIGEKGILYENRDGLFIREFDNGWAVYNRSGEPQTIRLPYTKAVSSKKEAYMHILPDLDGEIYLKAKNKADINDDGVVNIQDLVIVANALGKVEPDLNSDGVVNIQDLVIVANAFGQ